MNPILLDAGGALLPVLIGIPFLIGIILIEALVLTLMKAGPFVRNLGVSALMNIVSLIIGYVATLIRPMLDWDMFYESPWPGYGILFILSLITEWLVFHFMRKSIPAARQWVLILAANLVTYLPLAGLIYYLND